MRWLQRVHYLIEAVKQPPGTPGRVEAIEDIVAMAMKADTFELLDERGMVPETLSHRRLASTRVPRHTQDLEGDPIGNEHVR